MRYAARRLAQTSLTALAVAWVALVPAPARARQEIVIVRDLPAAAPDTATVLGPGGIARPAPPSGLTWSDTRDDAGRSVELSWRASPSDDGSGRVTGYRVERGASPAGPWTVVDSTDAGVTTVRESSLRRDTDYFYRITAWGPGGAMPALSVTGPVTARSEWMNSTRWSVLVLLVVAFLAVLYHILRAQDGAAPFVRRIPGIAAIEEAIGRATEMGRPVLFVPGINDIDEIQTVAGLVVLEHVARITARYETPVIVPVSYPIPHTIAEEMVRSGYAHAGRPDRYDPDSVRFVSPEQFAYVAAVTGIMMRDRPAAVLYMGSFYGESLMLAETGFATGAIQVAATANVHQLPFFVAACDHTLIGEELFAASAYLSGEPKLVGSLKGADLMKLVVITIIVVGCALETAGIHAFTALLVTQ